MLPALVSLRRPLARAALLLGAAWLVWLLAAAGLRWQVYPACPGTGLLAQRFNDTELASPQGPPAPEPRTRMSSQADADFQAPEFSLRLAGSLRVTMPGPYALGLASDDDGRLYVDGRLVVDNSGVHPLRQRHAWLLLGPGPHLIEVEYAQRGGQAGLELLWRPWWRGHLHTLPASALGPLPAYLDHPAMAYLAAKANTLLTPLMVLLVWLLTVAGLRLWLPRGWRTLALASLAMLLGLWLNSGTLALYGATTPNSLLYGPCRYSVNIDHLQFTATFNLLDGQEPGSWAYSVVLRRLLYPLLAYPLMKLVGFMEGGFITNLILDLAALISWSLFLRRRVGPRGAGWGTWLLACYPGLCYWGGLPYSYAIIVPSCLWAFMLLTALDQADTPRRVLGPGLALGVLCLGYDLMPFLGPAAVGLVLWRSRRLTWAALAGLAVALPTPLLVLLLDALGVPASSQNAAQPLAILLSYFHTHDLAAWWRLASQAPGILWGNFLASNFYVLPLLFLAAWALNWGPRRSRWQAPELALLGGLLFIFLFNNLAPPHGYGTFRGNYVARFYQPSLPVLLHFLARRLEAAKPRSLLAGLTALALAAQAALCLGPILELPLASQVYWRFYRHAPDGDYLNRALRNTGRRPLGFCAPRPGPSPSPGS